jgi:hypothetical protein
MKTSFCHTVTLLGVSALLLTGGQVGAATYSDGTGDGALVGAGGGILDITSVEVNNTATDLIFKISLVGDPVATDWGKYMIGIDSTAGGDTAGNGWARPISMSSGMDYFVGSWVDSGNGAEIRNWTGAAWALQDATYSPNPDNLAISKDASSVTIQFNFAGLGLALGNFFTFDVYTSGGGGTDSAIDALANPAQTVANWGDAYNSGSLVDSYTLVPEPSVLALAGLGGLALIGFARRRS